MSVGFEDIFCIRLVAHFPRKVRAGCTEKLTAGVMKNFLIKIAIASSVFGVVSCSKENKMAGKAPTNTLPINSSGNPLPEQASSNDGNSITRNGSGCYDEEFQVSRDSVTTVRCTPNPGQLFLPFYPAVESCPAGRTSVGTIIFHRTTTPIYHVNLGPAGNFPVRGYIYSTDLNGEQLSAAEKTLSAGTYQITFDQLLVELGVSVTVTSRRTVCN